MSAAMTIGCGKDRRRRNNCCRAHTGAHSRKPEPIKPAKTVKRSFKEQREMETLPKTIEALEAEQRDLHARMADADFYRQDSAVINAAQARLQELEETLEANYRRWEALES